MTRRPGPTPQTLARLEDLTWMNETGETFTAAATRLGLPRKTLLKWTRRHCPDLAQQLLQRELDADAHHPRNQWTGPIDQDAS